MHPQEESGGLMTGIGAALGGVPGAIAGSAVSGLFNRSSARDQMRFQERMANTQYQRAAKDLEAAGLNRVLALGSPAASPAGAGWSAPDLGAAVSSGSQASTAAKGQKSTESLQSAGVQSALASARAAEAQSRLTDAQEQLVRGKTPFEVSQAQSQAQISEKEATRAQMINDALKKIQPGVDATLDVIGKGVTSASDAIRSVPETVGNWYDSARSSASQWIEGAVEMFKADPKTVQAKPPGMSYTEWNQKERERKQEIGRLRAKALKRGYGQGVRK